MRIRPSIFAVFLFLPLLGACGTMPDVYAGGKQINADLGTPEDFRALYDALLPGMTVTEARKTMSAPEGSDIVVEYLHPTELGGEYQRAATADLARIMRGESPDLYVISGLKVPYVSTEERGHFNLPDIVTVTAGADLTAYLFFRRAEGSGDSLRLYLTALGGTDHLEIRTSESMIWDAVMRVPAKAFGLGWLL